MSHVIPPSWPVDTPSVAMLAYAAGVIDAEGHIGITKLRPTAANHMRSNKYTPVLDIYSRDVGAMNAISAAFGIAVKYVRKRDRDPERKQPCFTLYIGGKKVFTVIEAVRPYLLVKRPQADIVLRFRDHVANRHLARTKIFGTRRFTGGINKGCEYRVYGLSDEFTNGCEALHQEIRSVTRRGVL